MKREKVNYSVHPAVRDWLRDQANEQTKQTRRQVTEGNVIEQLVSAASEQVKAQVEANGTNGQN